MFSIQQVSLAGLSRSYDQLREQVRESHRILLKAQVNWGDSKLAYHEALQQAGYQIVLCLEDRYLVWAHPEYVDVIRKAYNDGDYTGIYQKLPPYAMYEYMT